MRVFLLAGVLLASLSTRAAAQAADGKALYEEFCRKCHGVRGTPPVKIKAEFPKVATFDADFMSKRTDDSVVTVLSRGKSEDMKSFKDKMKKDEMLAVAKYIREFSAKKP